MKGYEVYVDGKLLMSCRSKFKHLADVCAREVASMYPKAKIEIKEVEL